NNAINDMVRQRLLNRFTSEQAEGNAIYRLTPLGIGITDYYIRPAGELHRFLLQKAQAEFFHGPQPAEANQHQCCINQHDIGKK
ncbi:chromosome partition protein MukF, partial [Salmonella enterica subsp. enterica serovar Kentucky]|nr:chromosome partition protein MukF [Salmonella enterica subsp. enterica serovar Kentucky]